MMWVSNLLGGAILLLFGLLIRVFKLSMLIAGYNTASKAERAKYNEEELVRFVGNMLLTAATVLMLGGGLAAILPAPVYPVVVSWTLFFLIILGGVLYMNTGNRMKK